MPQGILPEEVRESIRGTAYSVAGYGYRERKDVVLSGHLHDKLIRAAQTKGATMIDVRRKANALRRLERWRLHYG